MQYIPVHTRTLTPPKDDLFAVLDELLTDVEEGDVILITSKVISIHHGRCVPIEGTDKKVLIEAEADGVQYVDYRDKPLTIVHDALISNAGIDESNGDGHYVLLPEDPYTDAKVIGTYIKEKHGVANIAVIITDSHSLPFRYGAMSVAIGFWGMEPLIKHRGKKDIFGREIQHSWTNIVDTLAAGSTAVAGETNEKTPIVIARGAPNLTFSEEDQKDNFIIARSNGKYEDLYKALFDGFTFK